MEVFCVGRVEQRSGLVETPGLAEHQGEGGLEAGESGVVGRGLLDEGQDLLAAALVEADADQVGTEHHQRIGLTGLHPDLQRLHAQPVGFVGVPGQQDPRTSRLEGHQDRVGQADLLSSGTREVQRGVEALPVHARRHRHGAVHGGPELGDRIADAVRQDEGLLRSRHGPIDVLGPPQR